MSSTVLSDQRTKQQTKKQGTTKQMEKEGKRKQERNKIKLKMFAFEYELNSDTLCFSWVGLHMIFTCSFSVCSNEACLKWSTCWLFCIALQPACPAHANSTLVMNTYVSIPFGNRGVVPRRTSPARPAVCCEGFQFPVPLMDNVVGGWVFRGFHPRLQPLLL